MDFAGTSKLAVCLSKEMVCLTMQGLCFDPSDLHPTWHYLLAIVFPQNCSQCRSVEKAVVEFFI